MNRAIALALLLAAPALAQVRETMTVEVIEVPVYVTGADGKPVRGLPRDAFELRVNGKPQTIDYFDSVDLAARVGDDGKPLANAAPRPARERRLYLLVFDLLFATKERIARAQHAAEAMIDRPESANDLFAVAAYSPTNGLKLASPFIRDRAAIRHAIYALQPADENDPLGVAISPKMRSAWAQTAGADLADSVGLTGEQRETIIGGPANVDAVQEPMRRLVLNQLGDLESIVKRMGALEGQKNVVFFSAGWDWRLMIIPGNGYNEWPDMHARIADLAKAFKAAGAFLYGFDVAGVRTEKRAMIDSQEGLRRVVRPTGGDLVANTNDFKQALADLSTAQESVYILGFQRRGNSGGNIDVRVKDLPHGAKVTFRPGFAAPVGKKDVDALELADIVLNDVPQSGVTLDAGVTPNGGGAEVAVSFARAEVVPQLSEKTPAVDLLLYVFDRTGATAGFKAKRISFDEAARVSSGYVTVREPFDLPKGEYVAKVLLHVTGTSSLGFIRKAFIVE